MKNRDQGSGTRDQKSERIARLLRQAVPRIEDAVSGERDLWPELQRRLRAESAPVPVKVRVPWFDWALAGGLGLLLAAFPGWIPVLLYYL